MTRFTLVRHGETDWNRQGRIQGATDVPLNDAGRSQAKETAQRLAGTQWSRVVSSGLARAAETAEIIADELGLTRHEIVEGLSERAHGTLEGLTVTERRRRAERGEVIDGLEPREHVVSRVVEALEHLSAHASAGEHILAVTHSGVIGSLLRALSDDPSEWDDYRIPNGAAFEFELRDSGLALVSVEGRRWPETRAVLTDARSGESPNGASDLAAARE